MALHSCSVVTHLPQRKCSSLIVEPAKDQWDWEITDYYIVVLLFVAVSEHFEWVCPKLVLLVL